MKVLITGLSGFVGSSLSAYFNKISDIHTHALDLRKPIFVEMLKDADVLIHLAGKAHDLKKTSNEEAYFEVNTELTKKVFDLFLQSNVRDFVYFSSVKAITDSVEGALSEDVKPEPKTPYGQSKQQAEAYLLQQKIPENKRLFILRPCMIHGPGNKGNLNLLHSVVKLGLPYPLAAFQNQRSFLSIENLNFILEKIVTDFSIPGGVYNVADDDSLSTNEVIDIMSKTEGHRTKLWNISPSLIKVIARIGDTVHFPLNSDRLKKLTESYVVSNAKIKIALKIDKLPVSVKDGLMETIKSFTKN